MSIDAVSSSSATDDSLLAKEPTFSDTLSRNLLALSSRMTDPICWCSAAMYRICSRLLPGEFDFAATRSEEIFARFRLGFGVALLSPLAIVLGALGKPVRWLGFALQKGGYTYVQGQGAEKSAIRTGDQYKIMNWNVCGVGGGMGRDHGGVIDWPKRLDALEKRIREQNPDVMVLEEIYDAALGEALISRLSDLYPHFYFNMGPSTLGVCSGLMVATRFKPEDVSFTSFDRLEGILKGSHRGFFSFNIKAGPQTVARIVATHLQDGMGLPAVETRASQVAQIVHHLATKQLCTTPAFLAGDLNVERDSQEHEKILSFLYPGYTGSDPTRTNHFLRVMWDSEAPLERQIIDDIAQIKESGCQTFDAVKVEVKRVAAHDGVDTHSVLSDHDAIVALVTA